MSARLDSLPLELLLQIASHLDVLSFLQFTSLNRALNDTSFRDSPQHWYPLVRLCFRIADQPVSKSNGKYWHMLYRRLASQSTLVSWGQDSIAPKINTSFRTDMSFDPADQHDLFYPKENVKDLTRGKIIADIQCGGNSVITLNTDGHLFVTGQIGKDTATYMNPSPLGIFPTDLVRQFSAGREHIMALSDSGSIHCWDSSTTGFEINFSQFALHKGPPTPIDRINSRRGAVQKVVAGWSHSSALISQVGIVIWNNESPHSIEEIDDQDIKTIEDAIVVPHTGFMRPEYSRNIFNIPTNRIQYERDWSVNQEIANRKLRFESEEMGQVLDYIVLELFVVFLTDLGKVFIAHITTTDDDLPSVSEIVEFPLEFGLSSDNHDGDMKPEVAIHIQGNFRHFAIFLKGGHIAVCRSEILCRLMGIHKELREERAKMTKGNMTKSYPNQLQPFRDEVIKRVVENRCIRFPCQLQKSGVISISFGDHHYQALHDDGTISSDGREPKACGTLGLGHCKRTGRLRGLALEGSGINNAGDAISTPRTTTSGRRIWFDTIRHRWLSHLSNPRSAMECTYEGDTPENKEARKRAYHDLFFTTPQTEQVDVSGLARWTETAGKAMYSMLLDKTLPTESIMEATNTDEAKKLAEERHISLLCSNPYFAINVASGGWSSCAQVLVDQDRVKKMMDACIVHSAIPSTLDHSSGSDTCDPDFGHSISKDRLMWENDPFPLLGDPPLDASALDRPTASISTAVYNRNRRTVRAPVSSQKQMKNIRLDKWPSWLPASYLPAGTNGATEWGPAYRNPDLLE